MMRPKKKEKRKEAKLLNNFYQLFIKHPPRKTEEGVFLFSNLCFSNYAPDHANRSV